MAELTPNTPPLIPSEAELRKMAFDSFDAARQQLLDWGIPDNLIQTSPQGAPYIEGQKGVFTIFSKPIALTEDGVALVLKIGGEGIDFLRVAQEAQKIRSRAFVIIEKTRRKTDFSGMHLTEEDLREEPDLARGKLVKKGGGYWLELDSTDLRYQRMMTKKGRAPKNLPLSQIAVDEFNDYGGIGRFVDQLILVSTDEGEEFGGLEQVVGIFPHLED